MDNFKNLIKEALTPDFLRESVNPGGLDVGFFEVTNDFSISPGGGWRIRFKKGEYLRSNINGLQRLVGPNEFKDVKPPISGVDNLDITLYGTHFDQKRMKDAFDDNTKEIKVHGKIISTGGAINEVKKPIIVVYDGRRLAVTPEDLERLKSGKDIVGKSAKHPGQEEWISAKGKWKIEESVNEGEEWHQHKKYSMEEVKDEIDLMIKQGQALIRFQLGYYGEDKDQEAWDLMTKDIMDLHTKSILTGIAPNEYFVEWVEGQIDNDLPNNSSGSFLTALTDIDGLLSAMNFENEDEVGEDLYSDEEWDEAVDYYLSQVSKFKIY